ncbi:MAG: hypothetical protein RL625_1897 [Gemmatimonadota bacterium]
MNTRNQATAPESAELIRFTVDPDGILRLGRDDVPQTRVWTTDAAQLEQEHFAIARDLPSSPTVHHRYGFRAIESSSARLAAAESLTAIAPCTPLAPGRDDAPMVESIARCSVVVRGGACSSGLEEQANVATDRASRSGSRRRRIVRPREVGWRQGSIPCGSPSTRAGGRAPATLRAPPVTNATATSNPD